MRHRLLPLSVAGLYRREPGRGPGIRPATGRLSPPPHPDRQAVGDPRGDHSGLADAVAGLMDRRQLSQGKIGAVGLGWSRSLDGRLVLIRCSASRTRRRRRRGAIDIGFGYVGEIPAVIATLFVVDRRGLAMR